MINPVINPEPARPWVVFKKKCHLNLIDRFNFRCSRKQKGIKMNNSNVRRCRICAREETVVHFSDIFKDNPELELDLKISKLLPVVVMPWDPMPHTICPKCIDLLISFNEFYDAARKAERFLKTFYPSVPESEVENVDPMVQVLDSRLKLPPKDPPETLGEPPEAPREASPELSLDSFIVNKITSTDSVFTCRECYRTFTKQSSAKSHMCMSIEDCGEVEGMISPKKCRRPLKIRIVSTCSGQFVCYLCQRSFKTKSEVSKHLKVHFVGKESKKKKKKTFNEKKKERPKSKLKKQKDKNSGKDYSNYDRRKRLHTSAPSGPKSLDGSTANTKGEEEERKETDAPLSVEHKSYEETVIILGDEETEKEEKGGKKTFSSCVFCDKVFSTTETLIQHQESHLRYTFQNGGHHKNVSSQEISQGEGFVCRICTMVFTHKKTLIEHEKYHCVDLTWLG